MGSNVILEDQGGLLIVPVSTGADSVDLYAARDKIIAKLDALGYEPESPEAEGVTVDEYEYTAIGTVVAHGCAGVEVDAYYPFRWAPGQEAYDRISANRGVLEKVVIAKVHFLNSPWGRQPVYTDTLNWDYHELDLYDHDHAVAVVTAHWLGRLAAVDASIERNNC